MTPQVQKLAEQLLAETAGMNRRDAVQHLAALGIVSPALWERHAIRAEVERTVRCGFGRCEAMEAAADTFCCSYAKVRQAVYYKPKS